MKYRKLVRYLLCTWPQRFALAFLTGFFVWIVTNKDLLIFTLAVFSSLIIYHIIHLRLGPMKKRGFNDEFRI